MNKYTNPKLSANPTVSELRASISSEGLTEARKQIALLFDEGTFIETCAYTKRGFSDFFTTDEANEMEGVITGYGAVDGKLAFAFVEDGSRMGGYVDDRYAKKITDLYKLAISNGAPIIGVFNSNGTNVFAGTSALAAYGKIISAVNNASGIIPQIAIVAGNCIGTSAAIAAMFDITVMNENASLYVSTPTLTNKFNAQDSILSFKGTDVDCAGYVRSIVSFLPSNSKTGILVSECTDNLNRLLGDIDFSGDGRTAISVIADNGVFYEVNKDYAPACVTAFAKIAGIKCCVVANSFSNDSGKIDRECAKKIAKFVNFADSFNLPIVTLVDSLGLAINPDSEVDFAYELSKLASSYASACVPKVTVILGHAIGASFVLLGSKSLDADIVYALDTAEIGALSAESGVAFAWDKYITEEKTRDELISEWKSSVSSVANAASSGEIDDIIDTNELRARICSSLLMLSTKGASSVFNRKILPF